MGWTIKPVLDSIREWTSTTVDLDIPLGLSRSDAEFSAQALLDKLVRHDQTETLSFTDDLPDILYALCGLVVRDRKVPEVLWSKLYDLVAETMWPYDAFGEKAEILGRIAYVAWSSHLGRSAASEVARWERASMKQCQARQEVSDLFAMPAAPISVAVCDQLFRDRATLLGVCIWLREMPNPNPQVAYRLGKSVHEWLTKARDEAHRPEDTYLLVDLALVVAGGSRLSGRYGEAHEWISLAEKWCRFSKDVPVSSAKLEYARLAFAHEAGFYERTLLRVAPLVERFVQLGLSEGIAKVKLLHATTLKELNRDAEALGVILSLEADPAVRAQPWLHGFVLTHRAELESRAGRPDDALRWIRSAEVVLRTTDVAYARAHCCGVAGEILRDSGRLAAAAECYRRGVEIYLSAGMSAKAAYMRIVLAEVLVRSGREQDAVEAILAALPTIGRESLVEEGIAAVALLKASVGRRRLDPEALKTLRESLDRSRREAEP